MIYWVHIEAFLRLRLMLCRLKCLNWIILPNWTMRENHIWGLKKKTNCIRISASWQQAPSNHILWPNKNEKKKKIFSFMVALTLMCLCWLVAGPALQCLQYTHLHMYAQHDVYSTSACKTIWEERLCIVISFITCFCEGLWGFETDTVPRRWEDR